MNTNFGVILRIGLARKVFNKDEFKTGSSLFLRDQAAHWRATFKDPHRLLKDLVRRNQRTNKAPLFWGRNGTRFWAQIL